MGSDTDPIRIVSSADAGFVRPLAVLLQSLANHHANDKIIVSIITDSITGPDRESLSDICDINWISAPKGLDEGIELPEYLNASTLWRLRAPDLLPNAAGRILYLDADTLVRRPLRQLWETELDGMAVGAVRDPIVPWFGAPSGPPWQQLGTQPDTPYFNSGVLLIDVEEWRREATGSRSLEILRDAELPWADQCALNTALAGRWHHLDPTWNLQAGHLDREFTMAWIVEPHDALEAALEDPALIHFNSSRAGRPWLPGCTHPYQSEWLGLLDTTQWAGWRPSAIPRRRPHRLRRAASIVLKG